MLELHAAVLAATLVLAVSPTSQQGSTGPGKAVDASENKITITAMAEESWDDLLSMVDDTISGENIVVGIPCKMEADVQDEEELTESEAAEEEEADSSTSEEVIVTAAEFKRDGVKQWNGWRWTWYSERVLPGGGLNIPGRHTDESGYVCDEDGYICLASGSLKKGTVVETPFGREGKVYDSGCASGTLDVYVNW